MCVSQCVYCILPQSRLETLKSEQSEGKQLDRDQAVGQGGGGDTAEDVCHDRRL